MKIRGVILCTLLLASTHTAIAHEGDVNPGARLGKVHMAVSCNAQAQKEFDLGLAYFHSFAWELYKAPLDRAVAADPNCGMAHWLHAVGVLDNPFGWPVNLSPKKFEEGQAALDRARAAGLATQREKDLADAVQVFYTDNDKLAHRARAVAFASALEKVAQRYPDDKEIAIIHALFLSATFDPADKSYSNQLRAAKILEPIFIEQPEHPGVAHYLIHSYDYPPLAKQGLDAARRYAKIAPDAAHALHMPSHIFTRVGAWQDSIESNSASAKAVAATNPNHMHAVDYMVYAHLQLGQDKAAKALVDRSLTIQAPADNFAVAFGLASVPGRYAIERYDWQAASQAPLPLAGTYTWTKYPHAEAQNAFARGLGAAMTSNVAAARTESERLGKLRQAAADLKYGYWVEQIDIQREVVDGLVACAEKRNDACIEQLRKAAAREDATEKHAVTPGPMVPAREVLANVLAQQGQHAAALAEYESVLTREPNRYRALSGAAQMAEKSGDRQKARQYYAALAQMTRQSDADRAELVKARAYQ